MESKSRFVSVRGDVVIPGNFAISKSIWKMRGAFEQNFVLRAASRQFPCARVFTNFCISGCERFIDTNIF